jgi:septal ring factor EnvC (AmiA/AmiB activator)
MYKTLKLTLTYLGLLIWGSTCFAQASSTSLHLDVSLRNEAKGGPDPSARTEGPHGKMAAHTDRKPVEPAKATASSEVSSLKKECSAIETSIDSLRRDSEADLNAVKTRLGMFYRFGQMGYAAPLLSSRDLDGAMEAAYFTEKLLQRDLDLFVRFRARSSEITKLRGQLTHKTKELNVARSRLDENEKAAGGFVRKPIPAPPAGSFGGLQGALPLPTSGRITNTYGAKSGATAHASLYKNGVLVKAPRGQSIQAVCDGVVVFADWFKEYGKMMIVDHGDHYFTLIAHAEQFLKTVDEHVKSGDSIATVGSTGARDGPEVYFEIRHYGKPVDPMEWLAVGQLSEE